jgi:pilus assembly protein Flp/PilA
MPTPDHGTSAERGASSVEYAILGSLIAAVIVVAVTTLGGDVGGLFDSIAGEF